MALSDLQAFLQQRLNVFDETLDVSPGSPVDSTVIQPMLRRLGTDPFTVDFQLFAQERLTQEFPDLATKEGDAIVDLLIKPAVLLMDPLIRENIRISNAQSFRDPTALTADEADALGANLFASRETGAVARGVCRIYLSQPQAVAISPANFITSRSGLHFFPANVQSIRAEEMLFNTEGTLYYFDVNVVAENPGDNYNIGPDELVSIANMTSAIRLTNKRRFRSGVPAESAATFIARAERGLTERSLVSTRGALAKFTESFPEIAQVGVVGFNDPEMHRDVIRGGGMGPIAAAGFKLSAIPDGENLPMTRRVVVDGSEPVDFRVLYGPVGPVSGAALTVHGGFTGVPLVRDVSVRAVVDASTLDLEEQILSPTATDLPWVARHRELTLSGIPGGILFPDGPNGSLSVPTDQLHIGGATDYYIRGTDFDATSILLDAVVGDSPVLSGTKLEIVDALGSVRLTDYTLDTNYAVGDLTYQTLDSAYVRTQSLQIENGTAAGTYGIIGIDQTTPGQPPTLLLDPPPLNPPGQFRWKIIGVLDIDLAEPKETKVTGNDLLTMQNSNVVQTASGVDFQEYGVGKNDVLRVLNGPDKGDFVVQAVLSPFFQRLQVDRPLTTTSSAVRFTVFRANKEGGARLPLVRVESIDMLDSSGQPTGSKVPYALPVDIQSRSFANVAHGVKEDLTDVILGIVTDKFPSGALVSGKSLTVQIGVSPTVITFGGVNPVSVASMVSQINAQAGVILATVLDTDRVGFIPVSAAMSIQPAPGDAASILFDSLELRRVADVRSEAMVGKGGWDALSPTLDENYDVVSVVDGNQIGTYDELFLVPGYEGLWARGTAFAPEVGRHVQVGTRSLGSARLYFLEPTTIEFGRQARFTATLEDGQILNFLPDKTISYMKIPAPPRDAVPKDGVTAGATLTSASVNFFRYGIQIGDLLTVTHVPVTGSLVLADPVAGLVNTSLTISLDSSPNKTLTFVNDSSSIPPTAVKRQGVVDQINNAAGRKICSLTATYNLEFEADIGLIIRGSGTSNALLGLPATDTDNTNDNSNIGSAGYYIEEVTANSVTVSNPPGLSFTPATRQHFQVSRPRLQRLPATTMATQVDVAGLYYCDIELISEGTGDQYNIPVNVKMSARGYLSDGYWLTTKDSNLTFSNVEQPVLHISRAILEVGVSDSLLNVTQISGQNLQVNYERSSLVESAQYFAMSETERVINQSPLVRHLIPYMVRFDLSYFGGPREEDAISDIESYIKGLAPDDTLDVSAVTQLVTGRGAMSVDHPIDLIAVVHNVDRTVTVERSQDRLNTGRLAAFFPELLNVRRKLS